MSDSRIKGLHRLGVGARIDALQAAGFLDAAGAARLKAGRLTLAAATADRMIENVVGVFGLPFAVAPNFSVNGRDCVVPLVVEEPSIVAGLAAAALLARGTGGFEADVGASLLTGQVHIADVNDVDQAAAALEAAKPSLLTRANNVHPRLVERGGGVRDIEIRQLRLADGAALLTVHLYVDTCDAMGANLVNTICEALAPEIAAICGGRAALAILSNLADRALVTARVRYAAAALATRGMDGARVCDGIVLASEIARADPYRAATHNKGIMNGIDALAIATGNDWRAIEAGAHAYAASSGDYLPLTRWYRDEAGDLLGEIGIPLKVATVGGTLEMNSAASFGIALTGVTSAAELAGLMAAVGLAQNFAALRALATSGIQAGHMKLHARSLAAAVGTPDALFDDVVRALVESGEVKRWKAEQLLSARLEQTDADIEAHGSAAGKIILFGEHAVVYGRRALAVPIPNAVSVRLERAESLSLAMPDWALDRAIALDSDNGVDALLAVILRELGITDTGFRIHVRSMLPRAMGLGSSAAVAVAIARAFNRFLDLGQENERINEIAFACERIAHGTPSGIDNTLATYAAPMLFRNDGGLEIERIELETQPPLLVACSGAGGLTSEQVAGVRARRALAPRHFDALFDEMDALSVVGAGLLRTADYAQLGELMNIAHGLLNAIGVSTPELETMVTLAREAGAAGAKLTGAGGGGSIVAICPGSLDSVRSAMQDAGFRTVALSGAGSH